MPFSFAPIEDFERECQMHFVCYSMCRNGIADERESLAAIPNQRTTTHFHHHEAEVTKITAGFRVFELQAMAAEDGQFSDLLAKSLIVSIYARWDEFHRPRIAAEHLVTRKAVRSDLMGDIRLIRNCIVHANSTITDEVRSLKKLPWSILPGTLTITNKMMNTLFNHLNREHIFVDHCPGKQ